MKKITLLLFSLMLSLSSCNTERKPLITFGLLTDIQYCDCDTRGSRFYRYSLAKLDEAVDFLNAHSVHFTFNLGDNIDSHSENSTADFNAMLDRLGRLKNPVFNTPGNHCFHGITENQVLYEKLNMPATYYFFTKKNWKFIVLNTNEVSTYANIEGTLLEQELIAMLDEIRTLELRHGHRFNGGISREQLNWLDNLLQKAEKSNYNVLIFTHHTLYPETSYNALNSREILSVISRYTRVRAVFSGHHHAGNFAYFNGIPIITVEGMVETEFENAFGIVSIYDDKIVMEGQGRMTSRVIYLTN